MKSFVLLFAAIIAISSFADDQSKPIEVEFAPERTIREQRFLTAMEKALHHEDASAPLILFEKFFKNHPNEKLRREAATILLDGLVDKPWAKFSHESVSRLLSDGYLPSDIKKALHTALKRENSWLFLELGKSAYPSGMNFSDAKEFFPKDSEGPKMFHHLLGFDLATKGDYQTLAALVTAFPDIAQSSFNGNKTFLGELLRNHGDQLPADHLEWLLGVGLTIGKGDENPVSLARKPSQLKSLSLRGADLTPLSNRWRGNVEEWTKNKEEREQFTELLNGPSLSLFKEYRPQGHSSGEARFLSLIHAAGGDTRMSERLQEELPSLNTNQNCNMFPHTEMLRVILEEGNLDLFATRDIWRNVNSKSPIFAAPVKNVTTFCKVQPTVTTAEILDLFFAAAIRRIDSEEKRELVEKAIRDLEKFGARLKSDGNQTDRLEAVISTARKATLEHDLKGVPVTPQEKDLLDKAGVQSIPHRPLLRLRQRNEHS